MGLPLVQVRELKQKIVEQNSILHISTGDMFRAVQWQIKLKWVFLLSHIFKEVNWSLKKLHGIVKERLSHKMILKTGYSLDGVTHVQLNTHALDTKLAEHLAELEKVLSILK